MKNILVFVFLTAAIATQASADSNWYVCTNLNITSKAPANVLLIAFQQGLQGLFNAANPKPPRALFAATPVSTNNPQQLTFGPVIWQGKHDGFLDFQAAAVNFNDQGAMFLARFHMGSQIVSYGNCVVNSGK